MSNKYDLLGIGIAFVGAAILYAGIVDRRSKRGKQKPAAETSPAKGTDESPERPIQNSGQNTGETVPKKRPTGGSLPKEGPTGENIVRDTIVVGGAGIAAAEGIRRVAKRAMQPPLKVNLRDDDTVSYQDMSDTVAYNALIEQDLYETN